MSAHRVCRERGCRTILSRFNPGDHCWEHTPDLTQTDRPAAHVVPDRQYVRHAMSDAFLDGVPGTYRITAAERRDWKRGR